MSLSDTSKINISIKKLAGKAQTSNDKDLANEGLPTGLTLSSETIFGDVIPTNPDKSSLYTITDGTVEYLRLSASFIAGTDTSSGRHAFSLKLPDDYETQSSNTKKGTYPFLNGQNIYITSGSLQLVPTSFSTNYEAVPYHTASSTQTQIPVLDARDWNLDYFNGIFFQQDPPATGDSAQNPRYVDAFLYVGASVKDKITAAVAGGADANAEYLVLSATGSLPNERVFTPGIGISGSDGGSGLAYTLSVMDSVVATLTGSQFSGNVGITGSFGVSANVSGDYAAIVDNDENSNAHGLKVTSDGNGAGTRIFDVESVSTTLFRIRGDGRVGIGKVASLPSAKLTVSSSNSDSDIAIAHKIHHIGDSNTFMSFQTDSVLFQSDTTSGRDNSFFVSGSVGSAGTAVRGTSVFGGDAVVSGSLYGEDIYVGEYIYHKGDTDTFIQFADDAIGIRAGGEQLITVSESPTFVKIGDGGDVDFQVRTLNDDNTLYVQGDTDRIGIGTNAPTSILHIKEAGPGLTLQRENNSNASTIDFLGALGNIANSITHDSSTNDLVFKTFNGTAVEEIMRVGDHYGVSNRQVIILSGSGMPPGTMQPREATDIAFFVSGAIGSRGSTTQGAAVFGGDLLSSGTFFAPSGLSGSLTRLTDGSSYLVAGGGINISSASNGSITISFGSSGRVKSLRTINATISAGNDCDVSSDFSSVSYDFNKVDVFVNGQMLASGSSQDYTLNTSKTGSIHFNFDLIKNDTVLSIVNN